MPLFCMSSGFYHKVLITVGLSANIFSWVECQYQSSISLLLLLLPKTQVDLEDWMHCDKLCALPMHLISLYLFGEDFVQKCSFPILDPTVSHAIACYSSKTHTFKNPSFCKPSLELCFCWQVLPFTQSWL